MCQALHLQDTSECMRSITLWSMYFNIWLYTIGSIVMLTRWQPTHFFFNMQYNWKPLLWDPRWRSDPWGPRGVDHLGTAAGSNPLCAECVSRTRLCTLWHWYSCVTYVAIAHYAVSSCSPPYRLLIQSGGFLASPIVVRHRSVRILFHIGVIVNGCDEKIQ